VYIPSDDVGAVIGKGGSTVVNLQKVACARAVQAEQLIDPRSNNETLPRLTIPTSYTPHNAPPLWSCVIIRGTVLSVLHAGILLLGIVSDSDQCVCSVPLTRSRHATIIGSRGTTIRKLSADNAVRILVPNKDNNGKSSGEGEGKFDKREVTPVELEGEFKVRSDVMLRSEAEATINETALRERRIWSLSDEY